MSKKIGIWGLGVVGKSAIPYFHQNKYHIEALDKRTPTPEEQQLLEYYDVPFYTHDDLPQFLERNDVILAACGIDLRPYSAYAHKWLSELDIFGQECTAPIIAITGSVGKTTITHLLSELLKDQGKKVFTGGNIGVGLLDSISQANASDYVVLECSSFQLERSASFAPHVAICSNIYPNHLDRHGTLENYVVAKLQIFAHQKKSDLLILPFCLFESVANAIKEERAICFFSVLEPEQSALKKLKNNHTLYFLHNSSLMMRYQTKCTEIFDFMKLPEVTYQDNIVLLATTLHTLNIPLNAFTKILDRQALPKHRLEKIATINSVDFYDDSKATIPASTLAALEKITGKPTILFLGGISKGVNRQDLVAQVATKVRFIYCFGKEAKELKRFCDLYQIPALSCATLDEAFGHLPSLLQNNDQILFSPAGASYDLFADYKERGNQFRNLVEQLKKNS